MTADITQKIIPNSNWNRGGLANIDLLFQSPLNKTMSKKLLKLKNFMFIFNEIFLQTRLLTVLKLK